MAMPIVISSHNGNTADASASTAASSSISKSEERPTNTGKDEAVKKTKNKASVHITSAQNLEETRNKNECLFPTTTK
jgi:propanediol dehydratase small subunit